MLKSLVITFAVFLCNSSLFGQAFDGAPRQTHLVTHEVIQQDEGYIGTIQTAVRSHGSNNELFINLTVLGFSLDLKAGTPGSETTAIETSYYSPEWQDLEQSPSTAFVWWESGDNDSNYIVKIPHVVFDDRGTATLSVIYYRDGRADLLKIKVDSSTSSQRNN